MTKKTKPRPWEITLTQREVSAFQTILKQLKKGDFARCPYLDSEPWRATTTGYCRSMCAKLFPTLDTPGEICCPCGNISTVHKIRVVRKLLKFNGIQGGK